MHDRRKKTKKSLNNLERERCLKINWKIRPRTNCIAANNTLKYYQTRRQYVVVEPARIAEPGRSSSHR